MPLPSVPRRSAPDELVRALKRSRKHPFGERGDRVCENVARLVGMTGVVPQEGDEGVSVAHQGSGVV